MGTEALQSIIYIIIIVLVLLVAVLMGVFVWVLKKDKKRAEQNSESGSSSGSGSSDSVKTSGIESMDKFLAFDEVVDNMILRKNKTEYVMVIHCKGVNYDLLGEDEKLAVESGFTQFLNTLRFPVQLYIQTRSLNLKDSVLQYEERVNAVRDEINKLDSQIRRERANGRLDLVRRLEYERRKKVNILEYGEDITEYVSRMSQNKDVLQQNTYVVVSYYTAEFGGEISNYSKEEIDSMAFSELYTRAQTLIRALSSAGVTGRVLNSEELAELLFIAYNRDDSDLVSVKRLIDAKYDSLYNTAKDVMEKQKEDIENKVEAEAVELTARSITRADKILKIRKENKEEIKRRAMEYVENYKDDMTDDLYNETRRQIEKAELVPQKKKRTPEQIAELKRRKLQKKGL